MPAAYTYPSGTTRALLATMDPYPCILSVEPERLAKEPVARLRRLAISQIIRELSRSPSVSEAARRLGTEFRTLARLAREYPELHEAFELARQSKFRPRKLRGSARVA